EARVRADPFDVGFGIPGVDQRFAARHEPPILRHDAQVTLGGEDRTLVDVVVELKLPAQFLLRERTLSAECLGPQDTLLTVIRMCEHIDDHEALFEWEPRCKLDRQIEALRGKCRSHPEADALEDGDLPRLALADLGGEAATAIA